MVIDVDDELFSQVCHTGTSDVGALNHENSVIRRIDCRSDPHLSSAGQLLVGVWHRVAHDDLDIFVERAQQPVQTERRSEAIAIGTNMRGDRETTFCLDQLDYLTKHGGERAKLQS